MPDVIYNTERETLKNVDPWTQRGDDGMKQAQVSPTHQGVQVTLFSPDMNKVHCFVPYSFLVAHVAAEAQAAQEAAEEEAAAKAEADALAAEEAELAAIEEAEAAAAAAEEEAAKKAAEEAKTEKAKKGKGKAKK